MIYCFDVDDTLLFSVIEDGQYVLKYFDEEMRNKINELYKNGHTIIMHTGRHWNHLQLTIKQLKGVGLKYHTLVCGKPVADFYIDDRGMKPDEFLGR
jgi:hydroxymethylpyrimidine pyrophosphatase-like HAD family hydrolase